MSRMPPVGRRSRCMTTTSPRNAQKGATLTELMILAPILVTTMLGSIDLGRLVFTRQVLTDLSREAANLVSRGATAQEALTATLLANQAFDLDSNGAIIISRVQRRSPTEARAWVVEQEIRGSAGGYSSHIGQLDGAADIPKMTTIEPGVTFTAVEIFIQFEPRFAFASLGLDLYPDVIYDAAFF
ncbi:MAG: pilus assembly protein [Myxococcales bacterium]|nr:MAG: pilus assembly protein [Myxococcales bacterium]